MLTISQLASCAGVTVRAVRHYHHVGLLPEPERDRSGYRNYGADAVVELVRIRTLAEAGVPLSRVPDLLRATPADFAAAVEEIDRRLRAQIRDLQRNRKQIAKLVAGDGLALPDDVVDYLAMLRENGVSEAIVAIERESWILIAAQWPDRTSTWIAEQRRHFQDPRLLRFYRMLDPQEMTVDDPRLVEAADLLAELAAVWAARPQAEEFDNPVFRNLLDSFADRYSPITNRLQELLNERGWTGWTKMERFMSGEGDR